MTSFFYHIQQLYTWCTVAAIVAVLAVIYFLPVGWVALAAGLSLGFHIGGWIKDYIYNPLKAKHDREAAALANWEK